MEGRHKRSSGIVQQSNCATTIICTTYAFTAWIRLLIRGPTLLVGGCPDMARGNQDISRPTGVTIVSVLLGVAGAVHILFGLAFVSILTLVLGSVAADTEAANIIGAFGFGIGAVAAAIGAALFFVMYGILTAKSWAWNATRIVVIISIVVGVLSLDIVSLAISGVILYYLYRPNVKQYFGREAYHL